jgi:signal peptidase I
MIARALGMAQLSGERSGRHPGPALDMWPCVGLDRPTFAPPFAWRSLIFSRLMAAPRRKSSGFWETVRTIVYAIVIALVVRTVGYEPFNIPSGSMIPTLLVGDYLFVSKYSYGYSHYSLPLSLPLFSGRIFFSEPKRGDVVVFKQPANDHVDYIKRLIGLPGDHIQVVHGELKINGVTVPRKQVDDYVERDEAGNTMRVAEYMETLPGGVTHPILRQPDSDDAPQNNTIEYVVPPGHYFMMGDNRDNSADSRVLSQVGYVPAENLVGRAEFIFFSANGAALWEVWKWPWAIRWSRFFSGIH